MDTHIGRSCSKRHLRCSTFVSLCLHWNFVEDNVLDCLQVRRWQGTLVVALASSEIRFSVSLNGHRYAYRRNRYTGINADGS